VINENNEHFKAFAAQLQQLIARYGEVAPEAWDVYQRD